MIRELLAQIERLRASQKRLQASVGACAILGLVVVLTGFAVRRLPEHSDTLQADEVVCRMLKIQDEAGKDRILLGLQARPAATAVLTPTVAMTPVITLMTANGQRRAELVGSETIGGQLLVHDTGGKVAARLSNGPFAARLVLRNRVGKDGDGIHLAAHSTGNYVIIHDEDAKQRILIGQENVPLFRVSDGSGRTVLELAADESGVLRWTPRKAKSP